MGRFSYKDCTGGLGFFNNPGSEIYKLNPYMFYSYSIFYIRYTIYGKGSSLKMKNLTIVDLISIDFLPT